MSDSCPSSILNSTPREIVECTGNWLRAVYDYASQTYTVVTTTPGQVTVGQWLLTVLAVVIAVYIVALVVGVYVEDARAQQQRPPQPPYKFEWNKRLTVPISVMALCAVAGVTVGYTHPDNAEGVRSICAVVGFVAYLVTCARAVQARREKEAT